jgi:hypothetical protein
MNKIIKDMFLYSGILILCVVLSVALFSNKSTMGFNWTFPYFSGAANFEKLFDWKISPSDFENVKKKEDSFKLKNYIDYKHKKTDDLVLNTVNNYGYVLVAFASQNIFPFLGDLRGVIYFQLIVHIIISLFLINFILSSPLKKLFFILFYTANPMIIHFTTFPFYYFWMFIPSFFIVVLIFKEKWRNCWVYIAIPILLFSLLIRPTTLFLMIFFFVIAFFFAKSNRLKISVVFAFCLFIAGASSVLWLSKSTPWHTMYIGIGAYPNKFGVAELADSEGYKYFYQKTKTVIKTDAINGNWNDPIVRQEYMNTLQSRYLEILMEKPLMLLRNALLNTLQVFSIGHIAGHPLLNLINTIVGFLVFTFLIYTRQFVWILAILANAVSFSLYYPPVPAYNFATYLLLVFASISSLDRLNRYRNNLSN